MSSEHLNRQFRGVGISPGFARGEAYVYRDILESNYRHYRIAGDRVESEYARVIEAVQRMLCDLKRLTNRVERELGRDSADIFRTHEAILRETSLLHEIRLELERKRVNAEHCVKSVFARLGAKLEGVDNPLIRGRSDDTVDLCKRLIRSLSGVNHLLDVMPRGAVLVARRLLPSDTVFLRKKAVSAVVAEACGTASHSAILARSLGVPVVSGIQNVTRLIAEGDELLVYGDAGRVIVGPDLEHRFAFEEGAREYVRVLEQAKEHCGEPASTADGTRIYVAANIGAAEDAELALKNGADAIGLYRLEQLYMRHGTVPTEGELFETLRKELLPVQGMEITVRLLDSGAGKSLPCLKLPCEGNPFFGRRGARLLLKYPDLLRPQLNAIIRLAEEYSLRVLVPMVTVPEEVKKVREALVDAGAQLGQRSLPPLGAMIETPAAALCAQEVAQFTDFLSIGTNDLTQYVMVADREADFLSHYYDDEHPAVLRLIRYVCDSVSELEVGVCGELAGAPRAIPVLLEQGIRHLSVLPMRIPAIKEIIRSVALKKRYGQEFPVTGEQLAETRLDEPRVSRRST